MNGLLTLNDWVEIFPAIDTVHTFGAEQKNKSTIQGEFSIRISKYLLRSGCLA